MALGRECPSGLAAQFLWVAHTVLAAGCYFDRTLDGDPGAPLSYEIDKTMEAWRQVGSMISDTRSTGRTTARIYFDRAKIDAPYAGQRRIG